MAEYRLFRETSGRPYSVYDQSGADVTQQLLSSTQIPQNYQGRTAPSGAISGPLYRDVFSDYNPSQIAESANRPIDSVLAQNLRTAYALNQSISPDAQIYVPSQVGERYARSQGGTFYDRLSPDALSGYLSSGLWSNEPAPNTALTPQNVGDYFYNSKTGQLETLGSDFDKGSVFDYESQRRAQELAKSGNFGGLGPILPFALPLAAGAGLALSGVGAAGGAAAGGSSGFSGSLGSALGSFAKDAALKGAAKGAIGGFLSGGDLSSALRGAGVGGLTGGYGGSIASGLGLSGVGAETFKGALQGASGGLAQGDLRTAGIGAALGGGGSFLSSGGSIPGLGTKAGAPLTGGLQGPTQGSGTLGSLTRGVGATSGGGSLLGGGSMLSDALKVGGSFLSQRNTEKQNEEILRQWQQAQRQASGFIRPYQEGGLQAQNQLSQALSQGFNPQDLASDEGYQFRLGQGQQALQRQMAASGLGQSGAALKAAQEYGQGLASQEFGDAYNRWLAQNQQLAGMADQGYNAATQQGSYVGDLASAQAQLTAKNQQSRNQTLADLLGSGLIEGGIDKLGGLFS